MTIAVASRIAPRPTAGYGRRSGYSLMELFLVVAILSVIALVAWPMLRRPWNKSLVQEAAQQLQQDLAGTRLKAIETGESLIFQYRPGSDTYYVGVRDQRQRESAGFFKTARPAKKNSTRSTARDLSDSLGVEPSDASTDGGVRQLPSGTYFATADDPVTELSDKTLASEETRGTLDAEKVDPENVPWSVPVRFYPSGRNQPAVIVLTSDQGYKADVVIEGLAGRIKILSIHR